MPPVHCPTWWIQEMSEKKSPPRKEKLLLAKSPQPSDGRSIKRKLIMTGIQQDEDAVATEKKHVTPKRKRMSFTHESSPTHGGIGTPRTPGSRLTVPLSERQQVALLMRMTDETSQGESSPKALSPQGTLSSAKKTPGDKKLHSRNARGETPLHIAAIKGDVKQVKKLIKAGVEVNAKDNAGWTPLHEACSRGFISLAKNLLKAGANVNIQSMDNDTPLHDAAGHGSHKLVELLLKHGANPLLTNSKGSTAVDAAASPDIDKLLRKEIIASSSESSSVDDARSPTSPESMSSTTKEEDRQAEFDDLSPRLAQGQTQEDWERLSTMSSSSVRKSLIPQSPDIVGASPRVTLKFQHLKDRGMWSSGVPAKSMEFQQQYKSYSVTVETGEERRGLLPGDSPCSSNDSDLYDPQLDSSSRRYEQPPGGSTEFDSKNRLFPSSNIDTEGWGRDSRDVNVDKNTCKDSVDSKFDHTVNKYPLTTHATAPFEPHFDFMSEEDASGDSFSTARDADSSAVGSNIPVTKTINHARLKEILCPASSPPSDTFSQTTSIVSGSTVSSLVATLNIGSSNPAPAAVDKALERTEPEAQCASVSSSRKTPIVNSGAVGNSLSAHPPGVFRWDLRSSPKTSVPSEDNIVSKVEESSMLPALIDREVRLSTKFDKDLRAASPKVPPLKIIFAPKGTLSSSVDIDKSKLLWTKPQVPYVLNPTQEKIAENQMMAAPTEAMQVSPGVSRCSTPTSHESSPAPGRDKKTDVVQEETMTATVEIEPSVCEQNEMAINEDRKEGEGETTDDRDEDKQKDESKEEEFTGRVTRSSVRSQQQKEKHGPGSIDVPSLPGEASSTKATRVLEESEDYMHPRKRKLRPKSNETPMPPEMIQPPLIQLEKPPNPYEMFMEIRKQIEMRRRNLISVPPKVPQSFNEYLMVSCSYVIQGNAASNLAVPMLPPPNSVEGPMRDLFLEQEGARYKLRLQHVIEREKLILSIEQEMVREHGRAARAEVNQMVPFSVCTILKDEEIYNTFDGPEQTDEREKNVRGRYNGRQFLSWLHDVGVKYAKIKELLLFRHHHEAESLHAVQKMDWEWKLKEVGDCDYNTTPVIDELHVPMVPINEDFDLLPG